jgi:hypothetical protein
MYRVRNCANQLPRHSVNLTDTSLEALKPQDKPYQVPDRNGLVIDVMPSGDKFWFYRYRLAGTPQGCMVGTYPKIGLTEARMREQALSSMLTMGQSPHV